MQRTAYLLQNDQAWTTMKFNGQPYLKEYLERTGTDTIAL